MSLNGEHALITGSSRGIGRGIALKLAERGVNIAIHYHQNEAAGNAVALLCSQEAGWITGQLIAVDGGSSLMDSHLPLEIQRAVPRAAQARAQA